MMPFHISSFQDLFDNHKYITLKNYLYNYRLRKRAIEKILRKEDLVLALEIGSGISPVVTITDRIVYTDVSFSAIRTLKRNQQKGWYVVADAIHLPFKRTSFSHVIASEVLEHLREDHKALREMAAVLKPSGQLIITFPHRHFYFALDDRFVQHFRRYELHEMSTRLQDVGLTPVLVKKVLGPLEKVTMIVIVGCIRTVQKFRSQDTLSSEGRERFEILVPFFKWVNRFYAGIAWLDAKIMPQVFSTVLLMKIEKKR
ncbi:MAG: methyltransferase domain-containing protein [Deltaproteobacteria bacterium]|nr:methyltransferase domain-containing protein [Deltaproteobacteria bacterium]